MSERFKVAAIAVFLTLGFIWTVYLAGLNAWAGNLWWTMIYSIAAAVTGWFLLDAIEELETWNAYDDEPCYCIHPIYSASGHKPHLNPRSYDA